MGLRPLLIVHRSMADGLIGVVIIMTKMFWSRGSEKLLSRLIKALDS